MTQSDGGRSVPPGEHVNCAHDPEGADGNPHASMICAPVPPGFWDEINERYRHVTGAMFPAGRDTEPTWADLTRPAPEPEIRVDPTIVNRPTATPPTVGMMEAMGRIIERVEEYESIRFVLAPAKWHAIMVRATEDERAALERAKDEGRIILSDYLPETETAYRIRLDPIAPVDLEAVRARFRATIERNPRPVVLPDPPRVDVSALQEGVQRAAQDIQRSARRIPWFLR